LAELHRLLASGSQKLGLITGRRRVGKTFLLTHAWDDERVFLFTASRTTSEINRRQLLEDFAAWSGEEIRTEDYPTWRTVFSLLLATGSDEALVFVLDEFQYLADATSGVAAVASELNAVWERMRGERQLLLLLSGSAVGTMEALAAGGGPLYGRFDWQHRLQPFDYRHAAEMAPFTVLRDRAMTYGIFGGTPHYLAAIDTGQTLVENVTRLMLSPSGEVRLLVETALDQEEGLRDVAKYRAILHAIAAGCTERNDIAQRTGLSNDRGLRDKLERLIELGYVETRQNIDARRNDPVRYGMADAAFRFYHRFVEPSTSMLERYPAERVWDGLVESQLDQYMGHEFERMARQAYDRRAVDLGLSLVKRWGRWEGADRAGRSMEIDLVAELVHGAMLTGSVKWNTKPIGSDVHWAHIDMLERAAHAGRAWAHNALEPEASILYVTAGGFADDFIMSIQDADQNVICWSLEDLYGRTR
jgi:hypothetical protein